MEQPNGTPEVEKLRIRDLKKKVLKLCLQDKVLDRAEITPEDLPDNLQAAERLMQTGGDKKYEAMQLLQAHGDAMMQKPGFEQFRQELEDEGIIIDSITLSQVVIEKADDQLTILLNDNFLNELKLDRQKLMITHCVSPQASQIHASLSQIPASPNENNLAPLSDFVDYSVEADYVKLSPEQKRNYMLSFIYKNRFPRRVKNLLQNADIKRSNPLWIADFTEVLQRLEKNQVTEESVDRAMSDFIHPKLRVSGIAGLEIETSAANIDSVTLEKIRKLGDVFLCGFLLDPSYLIMRQNLAKSGHAGESLARYISIGMDDLNNKSGYVLMIIGHEAGHRKDKLLNQFSFEGDALSFSERLIFLEQFAGNFQRYGALNERAVRQCKEEDGILMKETITDCLWIAQFYPEWLIEDGHDGYFEWSKKYLARLMGKNELDLVTHAIDNRQRVLEIMKIDSVNPADWKAVRQKLRETNFMN